MIILETTNQEHARHAKKMDGQHFFVQRNFHLFNEVSL